MGDRPALTPTVSPVAPHLAPGGAMGRWGRRAEGWKDECNFLSLLRS